MNVILACGGTGGHVYPAVAIAEVLKSLGHSCDFVGRQGSLEDKIISSEWNFHHNEAYPLVRGKLVENLKLPIRVLGSVFQAYKTIRKLQPQIVIGTGGYVSLPVILGAFLAGKTIYLQEQNAVAGVANKIGAIFASKVFVSSDAACLEFCKGSAENIGNPIRQIPEPKELKRPSCYDGFNKIVMVVGGSQGALGVNSKVEEILDRITPEILLYWQVGSRNISKYQDLEKKYPNIKVVDYINDIYAYMVHADVLVSRAGASTIAEILCLEKASILIPFPYATANHQEANARVLESAGAAIVELESEKNQIFEKIIAILKSPEIKSKMESAAKSLSKPSAAIEIVERIQELEGSQK